MAAASTMAVHVLLFAILVICAHGQVQDPSYFIVNNDTCFITGKLPTKPLGTDFCTEFASLSCCLPSFDINTIQPAYYGVIPQGPGCGSTKHTIRAAYSSLRRFSCLPCDPKEPQYRFRSIEGDVAFGGTVPPSPASAATDFTWRICKTFLYGRNAGASKRGLWGNSASHFDSCGVNVQTCAQNPVYDVVNANFSKLDSTCTSSADLVIPSVAYKDSSTPASDMLQYIAQTIPGFQFVVVDDEDANFNMKKTPCFGADVTSASATLLTSVAVSLIVLFVQMSIL